MIDNEEILIRQTECLGMMHELKDDIQSMHHTLYRVKGKLSFTEARKYLDITHVQLNELVRDKIIPCIKVSQRRLVFSTEDLDEYLESMNKKKRKTAMNKELETIIERYESILQDMHQTLKAIEQGKQDSQRISDIHQFLSQFNSIDEFLAHIRNIEERLFYLKDELTTKEAAIYLGMSVSTLYKKTMNSEIPFYRPSTRHLYFKRQELAQWMLQNRHATNEELQAEATLSGKTNLYTPKRSKRKQPQKTEKR